MQLKFWKKKPEEKALNSVDSQGWTRIFDWVPGAWQSNSTYDGEAAVLANPTVFSCQSLIQNDVGKLRPTVQKKEKGVWVEQDHSLVDLIKKPNFYQNNIQFLSYWINSKLSSGNTYVLKIWGNNGRDVIGLQILNPDKVHPLVADNGEVFYRISEDPLAMVTHENTVPASEIIHDRHNCFYHPLVGLSPIFAAAAASTMGSTIINNSKQFFGNGANPGGILTAPGSIGDDTAKRLKEGIEAKTKGENSGSIIVVGDGLKYESMRMNSTDAQLLEQLGWSDEKICSCYHVPTHMVGVGDSPSYNNIEALSLQYYSQCLQILIESLELCLDQGLGLSGGLRFQLDLDGLFRMDQTTLMDVINKGKGWIAPNEGRKKINLPPVEGGDSVYMQQQEFSLEALANRDSKNPLSTPDQQPEEFTEDSAKLLEYLISKELDSEFDAA